MLKCVLSKKFLWASFLFLFNIICIQSHENVVLLGKFFRLRLGKPVMERSSEISAYLPLLLFWFVLLQELTSMSFWCIYNPCLQPDPKYLQISCLLKNQDIEISFCLTVTNTLGALGLLAWIPWPHNISEIATFPGCPCSLDYISSSLDLWNAKRQIGMFKLYGEVQIDRVLESWSLNVVNCLICHCVLVWASFSTT